MMKWRRLARHIGRWYSPIEDNEVALLLLGFDKWVKISNELRILFLGYSCGNLGLNMNKKRIIVNSRRGKRFIESFLGR